MKELAIGETGLVDGVLVKCVEWGFLGGGCSGCAFYNGAFECVTARPCTADKRKDKKDAMFIQSEDLQMAEELSVPPTSV